MIMKSAFGVIHKGTAFQAKALKILKPKKTPNETAAKIALMNGDKVSYRWAKTQEARRTR